MAPPKSAVAQKLMQDDPTLLPSEDEDDSDFHLSDQGGNNSDSSDSDSDSDSGGAKRKRKRSPPTAVSAEPAIDKATVDDLWAQFNNPVDDLYAHQPAETVASKPKQDHPELVTIEVEYEFAGEKLKQKKQVARTSAEAQAYFARNPPPSNAISSSSSATATATTTTSAPPPRPAPAPSKATDPTTASLEALFGPDPDQPSTTATSTSTGSSHPPKQEAAPPPPPAPLAPAAKRRKTGKGGGLAGMAAAMGIGGKPAKLNTLEKSKLDWTSYVSSETGLEDSLAHARKDGYLDRRDFLDRVEGHKSEQFDQARQANRGAGKR